MGGEVLNIISSIWTALGVAAVAGGSLVTIAYGIFRFFGEKWLNAKFKERLAAYKHAQQKELEELRFKINTLMDRTVKLDQREFDVLPEAWGRLRDTSNILHRVSLGVQQYPDANTMSEDQLEEVLEKSPLAGWQKNELKAARDKTRYFADAMMWHNLNDAGEAYVKFNDYLSKNGIFIPEPVKSKFLKFNELLYDALMERRLSMQYKDSPQKFDKGMVLHESGPNLLTSLEQDGKGGFGAPMPPSPDRGYHKRSISGMRKNGGVTLTIFQESLGNSSSRSG
jgi:hypothetical protein